MKNKKKTIENAAEKQIKALKTLNTAPQSKSIGDLFSKKNLTAKAKDELEKIKKL